MGGAVSNNNFFNFNLNLNLGVPSYIQSSPAHCAGALDLLNRFFGQDMMQRGGYQPFQRGTPQCGCLPTPSVQQSGAPAGQGLQQNPDGSITTAGGYRIEANGGAEWKIFGPDGDQLTRVWGDPHVDEADGTKWDFTKSSDFVLPDGTRIHAKTNYDPAQKNGQSVTTGLEITNGADRASIEGVNGKPTTTMNHDAYEWRAAHLASDPGRDTFYLGGSGKDNVQWLRQREGQIDGVVGEGRGHKVSAGDHQIYDQNIDKNAQFAIDPGMRPPLGSRAWGNMVRGQINDTQAQLWGQLLGPAGAWPALQTAYGIHADHINGQLQSDLQEMLFGGWAGAFGNFNSPFNALNGMIDLLRSDGDWRRQLRSSQAQTFLC